MSKKVTTIIFIQKAKQKHGNKYDYSKVKYIDWKTKVIIVCPIHGKFLQAPNNHYRSGCPKCGNVLISVKKQKTKKQFMKEAKRVHGDKYDYSKTNYKNTDLDIIIICKIHGEFKQRPQGHLYGTGCPNCATAARANKLKMSKGNFIKKAQEVHGNKYNYSKVKYVNNKTKIIIVCKNHGSFKQAPAEHIHGKQGCPKCSCNISKSEIRWLNSLEKRTNVKIIRTKSLIINNKKFKLDGFDPKTNTVYEYYGSFWHGNPKIYNPSDINPRTKTTFGELYKKTIEREKLLKSAGYNLVTKWGT